MNSRRQETSISSDSETGRILLIIAGDYHDCDFVRRELLALIAETDTLRTTCSHDFACLLTAPAPNLLITYTANLFPDASQLSALRSFIEAGGRWLAIHASAAFVCFRPPEIEFQGIRLPGLSDTPDEHPEYMDLLGVRFVSHLAQQQFLISPTATPHPVTAGIPAFTVLDEPYILQLRAPCEVLLSSRYTGPAPGYANGPWLEDELRPQLLLHRHGAGEILYLAPGHACGRTDLRPFIAEMPAQTGPWHVAEYRQLLRQAVAWGTGEATKMDFGGEQERAVERAAAWIDRMVDAKQWPQLRAQLAATVWVDIGLVTARQTVEMTADAFVSDVAALNPADKTAYHSRSNNHVTINGATARITADSYGYVSVKGFARPTYEVWGQLEYELARHGDDWRVTLIRLRQCHELGNVDVARYRGNPLVGS